MTARRGAFASIMAIALIGLVGVALAAAAMMLHYQFQRTQRTGDEAQLRQMLLASVAVVKTMDPTKPAPTITLPRQLTDDGGKVVISLEKAADGQVVADIQATLSTKHMGQKVKFVRGDGGWKVTQAVLE